MLKFIVDERARQVSVSFCVMIRARCCAYSLRVWGLGILMKLRFGKLV